MSRVQDVETSIGNGIHAALHEIKRIENGDSPPVDAEDLLKMLFSRRHSGTTDRATPSKRRPSVGDSWSFFDSIVLKYLNSIEVVGDCSPIDFTIQLTCALVAICLGDYDDFERFVVDIYSSNGSGSDLHNEDGMMNMDNYVELLRTILPLHTDESTFDEHVTSFSDYLSSLPGLVHNENGPLIFPKSVAIQYHKKMRKQLLWPLRVALDQVKMKFLGVNYWMGLHNEIAASSEASILYLPNQAKNFAAFVKILSEMFYSLQNTDKLPSGAPPTATSKSSENSNEEILATENGIYTYRHQKSVRVSRRYGSPNRAVHVNSPMGRILKESFKSTDADDSQKKAKVLEDGIQKAEVMLGLQFLIIEDSKLQRKMMRRKVTTTDKDCSPKGSTETVFRMGSKVGGFPQHSLPSEKADVLDSVRNIQWTVMEACNGEEAIQMIIDTKTRFDVIFVDENLQHSGGYMLGHEFVKILRGHKSVLPTTIIIGCSANAERYVSDFLASGADAVWKKPMPESQVIYDEIFKYIRNRKIKAAEL